MYVTTATGFGSGPTPFTDPRANMVVCGSGVGFGGCSQSGIYSFQFNATGTQIGSSCSDFVFDTAGTTVFDPAAPPTPPYSGTYQWDPLRFGVGDQWHLNGITYDFGGTSGHPPDTVLQCARIDIKTKIVPVP
jgi:hypothetical protein